MEEWPDMQKQALPRRCTGMMKRKLVRMGMEVSEIGN